MTLRQMSRIKRWLNLHGRRHPVEQYVWDLVLTVWLLGCVALPIVFVLHVEALLPLCVLGGFAPALYASIRRRLHCKGRLRCDWLTAL
jgi:hypothetical protein